jgi:YD repeat-containing protein
MHTEKRTRIDGRREKILSSQAVYFMTMSASQTPVSMTPDWWVKCNLEKSRRGLIKVLSRDFHGGAKRPPAISVKTVGVPSFFPVALRPDSGSWHPLTGLRDHTHWTHHTRYDSSGRVISPTQRSLPDNTQHSQETNIHVPSGIRTHNPIEWAAANPRLDRAATWISSWCT